MKWESEKIDDVVSRLRKAATDRARGGPAWADYADAADCIDELREEAARLDRLLDSIKRRLNHRRGAKDALDWRTSKLLMEIEDEIARVASNREGTEIQNGGEG